MASIQVLHVSSGICKILRCNVIVNIASVMLFLEWTSFSLFAAHVLAMKRMSKTMNWTIATLNLVSTEYSVRHKIKNLFFVFCRPHLLTF